MAANNKNKRMTPAEVAREMGRKKAHADAAFVLVRRAVEIARAKYPNPKPASDEDKEWFEDMLKNQPDLFIRVVIDLLTGRDPLREVNDEH